MRVSRWSVVSACRRRWVPCSVLLAVFSLALRVPHSTRLTADLPHQDPTAVAHFLADFSNHPRLYTHITGSWKIEEESSNYTSWRYMVSYECGARCEGRAELIASSEDRGSSHIRHSVAARDKRCVSAPLLPWPRICEYTETSIVIKPRAGGGTRLEEDAYISCSVLTTILSGCDASAMRRAHLRALQEELSLQLNPR